MCTCLSMCMCMQVNLHIDIGCLVWSMQVTHAVPRGAYLCSHARAQDHTSFKTPVPTQPTESVGMYTYIYKRINVDAHPYMRKSICRYIHVYESKYVYVQGAYKYAPFAHVHRSALVGTYIWIHMNASGFNDTACNGARGCTQVTPPPPPSPHSSLRNTCQKELASTAQCYLCFQFVGIGVSTTLSPPHTKVYTK